MVDLKHHIEILKNLYVPYKANIVRMISHIIEKHQKSGFLVDDTGNKMTLEQFIDAITANTQYTKSPVEPVQGHRGHAKR